MNDELTLQEMVSAIYSLKGHKAPGFDNITSDDIKTFLQELNGGDFLEFNGRFLHFLFDILSDFWFNERVPHDLKRTVLRPFLKDNSMDAADPANYRPISLLNSIMKIYESVIYGRIVSKFESDNIFSCAQAAYRYGRSTADHILVLQELFLEYRFCKVGPRGGKGPRSLYLCFLDLRKAFDTVPRNILFRVLFDAGITGKILRVIQDLFSSNRANVLIGGYLSRTFQINTGVLQGSKLGPVLFILFINSLLSSLEASKLGAKIGPIHISTLGFADDIVLVSDSPDKLQKLINICETWANRNEMEFNVKKCKVMILNKTHNCRTLFKLYNTPLELVSTYKYLGITIDAKNLSNIFATHLGVVLDKAAVRVSTIKSFGFREDGFRLQTSVRLYKLLVRPILEYCAQALSYTKYLLNSDRLYGSVVNKLEHFQTQTLKSLIGAPKHSPPELVRLLCGIEPLGSRLDLLKLRYFWKLTQCSERNLARDIVLYRKQNFFGSNRGFCHEVFTLCCKYNAIRIWHGELLAPNPLRRTNPLRMIKRIVSSKSLSDDLAGGRTRTSPFSAVYLSNPFRYQKRYQLVDVFLELGAFHTRKAQAKFVRALLYGGAFRVKCSSCNGEFTDLLGHKLFRCHATARLRQRLKAKLNLYNLPSGMRFSSAADYFEISRANRLWRKCFTSFLVDADF